MKKNPKKPFSVNAQRKKLMLKTLDTAWGDPFISAPINGKQVTVKIPSAGLLMKHATFYARIIGFYKTSEGTKTYTSTINFSEEALTAVSTVGNYLRITESRHYCVVGTIAQSASGGLELINPSLFKSLYCQLVESSSIEVQGKSVQIPGYLALVKNQREELRIYKDGRVSNHRGEQVSQVNELLMNLRTADASSADLRMNKIVLPHVPKTGLFPELILDIENYLAAGNVRYPKPTL